MGPCGPSKCLQAMVLKLSASMDELVAIVKKQDERIMEEERLNAQRQEAYLATITALEEQVDILQAKLNQQVDFERLGLSSVCLASNPAVNAKDVPLNR